MNKIKWFGIAVLWIAGIVVAANALGYIEIGK